MTGIVEKLREMAEALDFEREHSRVENLSSGRHRWEPATWFSDLPRQAASEIERLTKEVEGLRGALTEIVEECHNGGYPNEIVATRMIERIEETAMAALTPREEGA